MKFFQPVDEEMWWDVAENCKYATFFHSPIWHKLAVRTFPKNKDITLGVELNNGVRVILPLLEQMKSKRLVRTMLSSFAGCYGNLIADGEISSEERLSIYQHVLNMTHARLRIVGNPLEAQMLQMPNITEKSDYTHILSLENSDFKSLFSKFSKGHKSSHKKGVKMNVIVREATRLEDYKAYFGAYQDSIKRWGDNITSQYPWELFENGFYLAEEYKEHIKLWLALYENKVIAGAWVFYWNQHVDWWSGASYAEYFEYYPNNVLQTYIIEDALDRGYLYYDFNPSGGHEGVSRFKGRFGAKKWPISVFDHESLGLRIGKKIKNVITS